MKIEGLVRVQQVGQREKKLCQNRAEKDLRNAKPELSRKKKTTKRKKTCLKKRAETAGETKIV